MKMSRVAVSLAVPALLLLSGCSGGKGESIAQQLCDCHESAGKDIAKKAACVSKQMELQKQIEGDASETSKYLQKMAGCKAAFGG
ncbi:MAG: hypothetical protein RL653_1840 [Pseudomonadota bacterium]|jgi:hypothetical protein